MTNIKGIALVMVGIIAFSGSCIYASELYDSPSTQASSDLETKAWELLQAIKENDALLFEDRGAGIFDPQKVLMVEARDLEVDHLRDLEFRFEIIDVSASGDLYTRSLAKGDQIQTSEPPMVVEEGELVTIHSAASIFLGPDEVHGAMLVLMAWEG